MLKTKFTFDDKTYRHAMNGHESVLHCHHYMSLTTKLAEDFNDVGGVQILRETAEDTIRPLLDSYFSENSVKSTDERLKLGAEYYAVMGMGLMDVSGNDKSGKVVLKHSHVDEGWVKKWGKSKSFINHFTCGFVAAVFGAAFDMPPRSFRAEEISSIATGNEESVIAVSKA
jgi:hypothetical protein